MLHGPASPRRARITRVLLGAVLAGLMASAFAQDQAPSSPGTPPAPQPQQSSGKTTQPTETDIGRVSTGPGSGENPPSLVPGPATDRAAAIAEKQQAPNLIDAQPLSEIVKLPDINTAEALQRISGISLETDSGDSGRWRYAARGARSLRAPTTAAHLRSASCCGALTCSSL